MINFESVNQCPESLCAFLPTMEQAFVYILLSKKLSRFYVGATRLAPTDRLSRHLTNYYGISKFTAKADDWEPFISIECKNFEQALKIEAHIKKMKSKKYIENLQSYPEIITKLLEKYSSLKIVNQGPESFLPKGEQ